MFPMKKIDKTPPKKRALCPIPGKYIVHTIYRHDVEVVRLVGLLQHVGPDLHQGFRRH
jgi:hypothetical protein